VKESKWYGQEKVNKQGDATVTFFQRDGKQSLSQKFKDYRNGVRSGTELASKYSKELGLPAQAFSHPKIKHTNKSISNEQLNQLFGTTKRRLDEDISFHKSDLLVSHVDSEKNIQVNIIVNNSMIMDDETKREIKKENNMTYFCISLFRTNNDYSDFEPHLRLAINISDEPNFLAEKDKMQDAIKALNNIKTTRLKSDAYQTPEDDKKQKEKFDAVVDSLIKALDVAIAKASLETPST
jgi:hypothetical protein